MKVTARTGASADAINRYRYEVRGEVEDAYRDSSRDTWYHYGNAVVYAIQLSKGQRVTIRDHARNIVAIYYDGERVYHFSEKPEEVDE